MYRAFIKPLAADVKNFILDTLFPISCLACDGQGFFVCPDCKSTMKILEHQRCIICQMPAPFGITHPKCLTPHGADQLISYYDYHDKKIAQIIIKGKYSFIPNAFKELGIMLAQKIKNEHSYLLQATTYNLIPIPLHSSRKRWRGFNQAEILCEALSKELNLPVADVLQRSKITKTQKDLNKEQRSKNVKDAFTVSPSPFNGRAGERLQIHANNFILVDDVTTTGSTLQQAAKTLKQNGATKVICLTVARD